MSAVYSKQYAPTPDISRTQDLPHSPHSKARECMHLHAPAASPPAHVQQRGHPGGAAHILKQPRAYTVRFLPQACSGRREQRPAYVSAATVAVAGGQTRLSSGGK